MAIMAATTYDDLDRLLQSKNPRTIGYATTAERRGNAILIRLHGNVIAKIRRDGLVIVSDAGYRTATTKNRINEFLPYPWSVYQENFVWYIRNCNTHEVRKWEGDFYYLPDGGAN